MARSASGESVLTRAVRIIEAFTPEETVLSVTQIAHRARLHPATASRLIAELEAHGLLAREPDRRVRVGVRLWELALEGEALLTALASSSGTPRPRPRPRASRWHAARARRRSQQRVGDLPPPKSRMIS